MKIGYARFAALAAALAPIAFGSVACSSGGGPLIGTPENGEAIQLPDKNNPFCDSTNAKPNVGPCTVDCAIPCGFSGLGTKYCTCSGGAYWQCPCIPPNDWKGATTAPCCADFGSPDGQTTSLADKPCDTEWAECVGTDPNTGTPKGCACVKNLVGTGKTWRCGSTNHWFIPEAGAQCGG